MPHHGALPYTNDPTPTHRQITNNPIQYKPIYISAYLGSIVTTKSYTNSICREKKMHQLGKVMEFIYIYIYISVNGGTTRIESCMTTSVSKLNLCR
jgi:hypothetical protein